LTELDFDQIVGQYHAALNEFFKGNPEPAKAMYSHRGDVTLANPFGPAVRGWKQVAETIERAASLYKDGAASDFENVAKYVSVDLAYIVELERFHARVGGSQEIATGALRVTSIFRREDGAWKIAHRHADPITTGRSPESVVRE
jgi:ketosteroid isomerase-like protein